MLDSVKLMAGGYCTHPELMTLRGGSLAPCPFPSAFALILHARRGPILFDTGYSAHFMRETDRFPNRFYRWLTPVHRAETECAAGQLVAMGIQPEDVRHIVISHFHADHVSGLRDFPRARLICARAAWQSVATLSGLQALRRGILPGLLPLNTAERIDVVEDKPPVPLPAALAGLGEGYDLFGDGTLIAINLPGHGAGQIGLVVQQGSAPPLLLAADAAWSRAAIRTATPPPAITTAMLGGTIPYRRTLQRLHELYKASPEVEIVPSHCRETLAAYGWVPPC